MINVTSVPVKPATRMIFGSPNRFAVTLRGGCGLNNGHRWNGMIGVPITAEEWDNPQWYKDYYTLADQPLLPAPTPSSLTLDVGWLSQESIQNPTYQELDFHPPLSTGLCENPCHHEDVDMSIVFNQIQCDDPSITIFEGRGGESSGWNAGWHTYVYVEGTFINNTLVSGKITHKLGPAGSSYFNKELQYFVEYGRGVVRLISTENGRTDIFNYQEGLYIRRVKENSACSILCADGSNQPFYLDQVTKWSEPITTPIPSQIREIALEIGRSVMRQYSGSLSSLDISVFSKACYKNMNLRGGIDVNMVENLASLDLKSLAKLPRKLKSCGHTIKNVKDFVSKASSLYLGKKYGYDNTVRDLSSILQSIKKNGCSLMRYNRSIYYGTDEMTTKHGGHLTLKTKTALLPLCTANKSVVERFTNSTGLEMTVSQFWDCVPFSFVVDWLVKVGELLEQIDARALCLYRFEPEYILYSAKYEKEVPLSSLTSLLPPGGKVTSCYYREYDRCVSKTLPPVPHDIDLGAGLNAHAMEAGALVLNSIK